MSEKAWGKNGKANVQTWVGNNVKLNKGSRVKGGVDSNF